MASEDCIFCKIVSGAIPCFKIYEDDLVLAFLDIGPVSDGHTLVIPKEHFADFDSCPGEVIGSVTTRIGVIAQAIVSAMGSDGYNVLCNNGRSAGQLVDHVHFHIIPRRTGDMVIGGWPKYEYADGRAAQIAVKICEKI